MPLTSEETVAVNFHIWGEEVTCIEVFLFWTIGKDDPTVVLHVLSTIPTLVKTSIGFEINEEDIICVKDVSF